MRTPRDARLAVAQGEPNLTFSDEKRQIRVVRRPETASVHGSRPHAVRQKAGIALLLTHQGARPADVTRKREVLHKSAEI